MFSALFAFLIPTGRRSGGAKDDLAALLTGTGAEGAWVFDGTANGSTKSSPEEDGGVKNLSLGRYMAHVCGVPPIDVNLGDRRSILVAPRDF